MANFCYSLLRLGGVVFQCGSKKIFQLSWKNIILAKEKQFFLYECWNLCQDCFKFFPMFKQFSWVFHQTLHVTINIWVTWLQGSQTIGSVGGWVPPDQGQPPAGGVSPPGGCLALAGGPLHPGGLDGGQQHSTDGLEVVVRPSVYRWQVSRNFIPTGWVGKRKILKHPW